MFTQPWKQSVTLSVEKETSSNNHTLPDYVTNCEKKSVARSRGGNDLPNNPGQQKLRNCGTCEETSSSKQEIGVSN